MKKCFFGGNIYFAWALTELFHFYLCIVGLDPSGYRHQHTAGDENEDEALLGAALSDEEKYRDCERLKISCCSCEQLQNYDSVFSGVVSTIWFNTGFSFK